MEYFTMILESSTYAWSQDTLGGEYARAVKGNN